MYDIRGFEFACSKMSKHIELDIKTVVKDVEAIIWDVCPVFYPNIEAISI